MNKQKVIYYVKKNFPKHSTQSIADALNLSISQIRTIAKNHQVKK